MISFESCYYYFSYLCVGIDVFMYLKITRKYIIQIIAYSYRNYEFHRTGKNGKLREKWENQGKKGYAFVSPNNKSGRKGKKGYNIYY